MALNCSSLAAGEVTLRGALASKTAPAHDAKKSWSKVRSGSSSSEASTAAPRTQSERSLPSPSERCPLLGRVWPLSQDKEGCREVQKAFDGAASDSLREALAQELHGHVAEAMRDPNANHVLQKCISTLSPDALQFMIDELVARDGLVVEAAKHRYGCRIVQQLLRKCSASQVSEMAEAVLGDALKLSCRLYGNCTVQHLLQFGTEEQRYQLVRMIERNAGTLCHSLPGSGTVAAAMEFAAPEDRIWIARAVLQEPGLLTCLAKTRQGSGAVVHMLQVLRVAGSARQLAQACAETWNAREHRNTLASLEAQPQQGLF